MIQSILSIAVGAVAALAVTTEALAGPQVLGISAGSGLFGGLLSTMAAPGALEWRKSITQALSAAMITPFLVWAGLVYPSNSPPLTFFPVFATSLCCGAFAWTLFYITREGLEKIRPTEIANWIRGMLKAVGSVDGGDKGDDK